MHVMRASPKQRTLWETISAHARRLSTADARPLKPDVQCAELIHRVRKKETNSILYITLTDPKPLL